MELVDPERDDERPDLDLLDLLNDDLLLGLPCAVLGLLMGKSMNVLPALMADDGLSMYMLPMTPGSA